MCNAKYGMQGRASAEYRLRVAGSVRSKRLSALLGRGNQINIGGCVRGTCKTKALKSGGVFTKDKTIKQSFIIWLAALY